MALAAWRGKARVTYINGIRTGERECREHAEHIGALFASPCYAFWNKTAVCAAVAACLCLGRAVRGTVRGTSRVAMGICPPGVGGIAARGGLCAALPLD